MVGRQIFVSVSVLAIVVLLLLTGCSSGKEKPAVTLDGTPTVSFTATVASTPFGTPTVVPSTAPATVPPATASAVPARTPQSNYSSLQLAIVDGSGNISLVAHDGRNKKKLIDGSQCPKPVQLLWSPTGDRLACLSQDFAEIDTGSRNRTLARYDIVVADIEGRVLKKIGSAGSLAWSPNGQRMAFSILNSVTPQVTYTYRVADADGNVVSELPGMEGNLIWSPDGSAIAYNDDSGEVAIYDISTKEIRRLGSEIDRALAWALGGKALLVISNLVEEGIGARYDSHLLDLTTGELRKVPALYSPSGRLWISADGKKAVVPLFPQQEGGAQLGILDLTTLTTNPIPASTIRYPSEIIPFNHVIFSPDSSFAYWADVTDGLSIYRAHADGTRMVKIASMPGIISVGFSRDLTKMAYRVPGNPPTLRASNLDGSEVAELGPVIGPIAWRPSSALIEPPADKVTDWGIFRVIPSGISDPSLNTPIDLTTGPLPKPPTVYTITSMEDVKKLLPVHYEPTFLPEGFSLSKVEGRKTDAGEFRLKVGDKEILVNAFEFTLVYRHTDGRGLSIRQGMVPSTLPWPVAYEVSNPRIELRLARVRGQQALVDMTSESVHPDSSHAGIIWAEKGVLLHITGKRNDLPLLRQVAESLTEVPH